MSITRRDFVSSLPALPCLVLGLRPTQPKIYLTDLGRYQRFDFSKTWKDDGQLEEKHFWPLKNDYLVCDLGASLTYRPRPSPYKYANFPIENTLEFTFERGTVSYVCFNFGTKGMTHVNGAGLCAGATGMEQQRKLLAMTEADWAEVINWRDWKLSSEIENHKSQYEKNPFRFDLPGGHFILSSINYGRPL